MLEISLIIPAFNEGGIIGSTVAELSSFMRSHMPGRTYEIIVVDDGSRDGMAERLAELGIPELRLERHARNRGRGAAIRTGFATAKGRYVVTLDADLSYAPDHIPRLLAPLESGDADIVLASAYHPQGVVKNVPWFRVMLSRYGNQLLRAGVRGQLHTLTCMVRAYNRHVLDALEFISDGKDLHIEIIQKANLFGYRIAEVPATLNWRDKNRSKRIGKGTRFPIVAMSGTIVSHLVYNYVLRPGAMLLIPVVLLALVVALGAVSLAYGWIVHFMSRLHEGLLSALYLSLRDTLIAGGLTLTLMGGSAFVLLIFLAFYFQSHQNKKQFEELYILLARTSNRVKQLERNFVD